jgi:hypothetical protein
MAHFRSLSKLGLDNLEEPVGPAGVAATDKTAGIVMTSSPPATEAQAGKVGKVGRVAEEETAATFSESISQSQVRST